MIEELGRVVAVEDALGRTIRHDTKSVVWVETIRQSACDACSARKGCGHSVLAKVGGQKHTHLKLESPFYHAIGDNVMIGVPEDVVLKGSLIAYMMPLLLMVLTAVVANGLGGSDLVTMLVSLAGLALGFGIVRLHFVRTQRDPRYQPQVLRLLSSTPSPCATTAADIA